MAKEINGVVTENTVSAIEYAIFYKKQQITSDFDKEVKKLLNEKADK